MTDSASSPSLPYLCQISETVDGGDPSKMLRCDDDDTFVLTGGKSDIALFPLQLPAGDAGTNLDRLMACPPKSVSRNGWKCHSHSRLPSLAHILVLFKSCDLSRIDIPNNHTAAFTNAVQVPLAANWTKFGMLALILSYVSVGQSNSQDKIPTAFSQPCLQMKLNS